MTKLSLIAAGIAGGALAALALGAASAQAHEEGSLPAPAYAYAGGGYADEGPDCGRDQFTILGAHAGATVLGFNAGVGGHFGFGDGCHRHHRHPRREEAGYGPPRGPDPYPAAYPQAPWGAPYAYRAYAPPPPPPRPMGGPCGCDPRRGW